MTARSGRPRAWPELFPVLAATAAAAALAALVLAVMARADVLLVDFREWRPVTTLARADDSIERRQRVNEAQRPFRVTVRLPVRPRAGAYRGAEAAFAVDPDAVYCFSVLTFSEQGAKRPKARTAAHRAVVWVDDEVRAAVAAVPGPGHRLHVSGIRSPGGMVRIRVGLRAEPRAARQPISTVTHFEHAHFGRCGDESAARAEDRVADR
jgi:hypothetical protein